MQTELESVHAQAKLVAERFAEAATAAIVLQKPIAITLSPAAAKSLAGLLNAYISMVESLTVIAPSRVGDLVVPVR